MSEKCAGAGAALGEAQWVALGCTPAQTSKVGSPAPAAAHARRRRLPSAHGTLQYPTVHVALPTTVPLQYLCSTMHISCSTLHVPLRS